MSANLYTICKNIALREVHHTFLSRVMMNFRRTALAAATTLAAGGAAYALATPQCETAGKNVKLT